MDAFPEYSIAYDDGTGDISEELLAGLTDSERLGYWATMTTRSGTGVLIKTDKYVNAGLPKWFLDLIGVPNPRSATIEVSSPDGVTAQLTIQQHLY